jgi:hypothetical protein
VNEALEPLRSQIIGAMGIAEWDGPAGDVK